MRILTARWACLVNLLTIACDCGKTFEHRADRWTVVCPRCERHAFLGDLREIYFLFRQTVGATA